MTFRDAVMLFFILVVLAAGAALISMQIFSGPAPAPSRTLEQGPDDSMLFDSPLSQGEVVGEQLYFPLAFNVAFNLPTAKKKGCGGCTVEELSFLGAAHSYVWGPRTEPGVIPLIKPGVHQVWEARDAALREGWLIFGNEPDLEQPVGVVESYYEAEKLGVGLVLATGSHLDKSLEWVRGFRVEYYDMYGRWPSINALGAHCYYDPQTVGDCRQHVASVVNLAREWGIGEVWVTEWNCIQGQYWSQARCLSASEQFVEWMEGEDMITRYFIFGARIDPQKSWNRGFDRTSLFYPWPPYGPTGLGEWYRGVAVPGYGYWGD